MVERLKSNYKVLAFMVVLFVFTVFVKSSEINAAVAGNGRIYGIFNATGTTGKYVNANNELYSLSDGKKIADNVVSVNGNYYLTSDHKLYVIYYDQRYAYSGKWVLCTKFVTGNVKELPEYSMSNIFCVVKRNGELWKLSCNRYEMKDGAPIHDAEKIMDNVKTGCCLYIGSGYYYYALKKDNTLWGWGANAKGEIGNGTTYAIDEPYKIMDNVKSFYLDSSHYAMGASGITCFAITKDNDLYAWGMNDESEIPMDIVYEQFGSYESVVTSPVKIMSGVKSVISATGIVGAIKTNKTLWVWGTYFAGWSGASAYRSTMQPIKIASKVKSAGLETYNGTTNVYYIDKNDTMWGKYLDKLDEAAIKCIKKVKYLDSFSHVVCTNSGKLYYYTINGKDYSAREIKKVVITSGM